MIEDKIRGIELEKVKQNSPLDCWFYEMIQKKESELTLLDLSRLLRQDIYFDTVIPLAWKNTLTTPFCGEMYEGQLVELLIRASENNPEKKRIVFMGFLRKILRRKLKQMRVFAWLCRTMPLGRVASSHPAFRRQDGGISDNEKDDTGEKTDFEKRKIRD